MADLDEIMQNKEREERSELERKVEEENDWTPKNIIWDAIKFSPIAALTYATAGLSSIIIPASFGLAKYVINRQKGKKTKWNDMRKTLAVGNIGGAILHGAYAIPDMLVGNPVSLIGQLVKTFVWNPIIVTPLLWWLKSTQYAVDKYGGYNYLKGFLTGESYRTSVEAYGHTFKKSFTSNALETLLTLSPIHFYSLNYLQSLDARVAVGALNSFLFSLISGDKGLLKTVKEKVTGKKGYEKPDDTPIYHPSFGNPYRRVA